MDAFAQSAVRLGTWIWANAGKVAAIFGVLSPLAVWLVRRWTARWRLSRAAVPYTIESFVDRAKQGDQILHIIRWFLRAGIDTRLQDEKGRTALVVATTHGQIETVRLLVCRRWRFLRWRFGPRRTDRDHRDGQGITPVEAAVSVRRRDVYDVLVAADPKRVVPAAIRAAVLRLAVADGDTADVARRVEGFARGEIDAQGDDGWSALHLAVERAQPAIVRLLLDANADPNKRHDGDTALLAATRHGLGAIAEALAACERTDVDAAGAAGETALILAAEGGSLGIVRALIARNANAAAADRRGRTALMAAILGDYKSIEDMLHSRTTAGEAEARLMLASAAGDEQRVREWLDAGANPNAQAATGRSALLDAARGGHVAAGRLLIATRGVNLDITDDAGDTPLMLATRARSRELVAMLERAGADARVRRRDGWTVMFDAATSGHAGIVDQVFESAPAPEEIDAVRDDGATPLLVAVETGERSIVIRFLDAGANPNVETKEGVTPLMIALTRGDKAMTQLLRDRGAVLGDHQGQLLVEARRGSLARVQQLLDLGVSANLAGPRGSTPLLEAVQGGHLDVVEELLRRGADANHSAGGRTALGLAVRGGSAAIVDLLLGKGATVDGRDRGGKTPLLIACERFSTGILDALLAANADVNAADEHGRTPLLVALVTHRTDLEQKLTAKGAIRGRLEARLILAARSGSLADVQAILAERPNIDTPAPGGETALLAAAELADIRVVEVLLAAGAEVNVRTTAGKTPLAVAARTGDPAMVKTLLAAGAQADLTGPEDRTPLMIAAAQGHLAVVEQLLDAKNNPNDTDRSGFTALMLAAEAGCVAVAEALIAASAIVDARGPGGRTPLMLAAAAGEVEMLRLLVERGADVDARDDNRSTALILACLYERLETVADLLSRRVDTGAQDAFGQSALMLAILSRNATLETMIRNTGTTIGESEAKLIGAAALGIAAPVRKLLADGVDVNARRLGDDTALIAAIVNGHSHIARMLIDHGADVNLKGRDGRTALIAAASHADLALVRALTAHHARTTCEAMDESGMIAVLATHDPIIRVHLKEVCGALLPEDRVYVTNKGRCYHLDTCGTLHGSGQASLLADAVSNHLRPCSTCITNQ